MRAVVMAGGLGTRLRPLTTGVPKPLLPVVGRPMIEHVLLLARHHGIDEAVVTVQHLAPMIRRRLGGGADLGMRILYGTEPRPLGTAGGVRLAVADNDDEALLVLSGDAVTDVDLSALIKRHRESQADLTMALTRREDPREFGLVDADADGWVRRFREKPEWSSIFSDTVSAGIYVVSREVIDAIPHDVPWDWSTDVIPRLLADDGRIQSVVLDGYWEDVGDLEAYRRVQVDALDRRVQLTMPASDRGDGVWIGEGAEIAPGATVQGPCLIGPRSVIEEGARVLAYSVLGEHCLVRTGAQIERSTMHDNVYIGADADIAGAIVGRGSEIGAGSTVAENATIADGCVLEREVDVTAGSLIYPGKSVESGTTVSGSVVWDAKGHRTLIDAEGMRGEVGVEITPETVVRLAGTLGTLLSRGSTVALGRDHSTAASAYVSILAGALRAAGLDVHLLRAVPLAVLRDHVRQRADAGVYVRVTSGDASSLDMVILRATGKGIAERARELNRIYTRREFRRAIPGAIGSVIEQPLATQEYADRLRQAMGPLPAEGLRVVVDGMGGTSTAALNAILAGCPAELVLLGTQSDPLAAAWDAPARAVRLRELADVVTATGASLGIAIDASGERLWLVDELGQVLDDDRCLLVVLDLVAAEAHGGTLVVPSTSSRIVEQVAAFHGSDVRRAPRESNDEWSGDELLRCDGEGGFALEASLGERDAIAATVLLLGLVARTHLTLSEIDARIPRTHMVRRRVPTPWSVKAGIIRAVAGQAQGRPTDTSDGVRLAEHDGAWCLVLPDPKESQTCLWVEAADASRAEEVADHWTHVIADVVAEATRSLPGQAPMGRFGESAPTGGPHDS